MVDFAHMAQGYLPASGGMTQAFAPQRVCCVKRLAGRCMEPPLSYSLRTKPVFAWINNGTARAQANSARLTRPFGTGRRFDGVVRGQSLLTAARS